MIQLKIIKGPQKVGEEFEIKTGESCLLGRGKLCDVQLLAFGISKQHCKLTAVAGGRVEVEDLNSSNGTFVNGVQIQKHVVRPGDSLSLSNFLFQINWKPDALPPSAFLAGAAPSNIASFTNSPSFSGDAASEVQVNIAPQPAAVSIFKKWIDPVAENFPIHKTLLLGFFGWTFVTVLLSVFPFSKEANLKIQETSIKTAKLYARQLARINAKAVIEQRIPDIVGQLDQRPGQTPGILRSYIFDAARARILAPASEAGNALPSTFAVQATQQNEVWWTLDPVKNIAYVSAPILVGTPEGDSIAATAFVEFDPTVDSFSFAAILSNAFTSLIILLLFASVAVFVYQRFILAPVARLAAALERAVLSGVPLERTSVQWPELQDIYDKVSVLIGRLPNTSRSAQTPEEWSLNVARELTFAAASFDSTLRITEWNGPMEIITGVRRDYAVGSDIGVASRDTSFEASVRDLAERAQISPWVPQNKNLDFQGRSCELSMVYGANHYLLLIRKGDEA